MEPTFYAPDSTEALPLEGKVPHCTSDADLVKMYQCAVNYLPAHLNKAFQKFSGVPAKASKQEIPEYIRKSYAQLSRVNKRKFLTLAATAMDIKKLLEDGKEEITKNA